eukprot:NODE_458_length_8223_cov_0.302683.p8 type:complete len:126 gc:universal NODE_458_length_8223_cov_0.302683:1972-1595(-)
MCLNAGQTFLDHLQKFKCLVVIYRFLSRPITLFARSLPVNEVEKLCGTNSVTEYLLATRVMKDIGSIYLHVGSDNMVARNVLLKYMHSNSTLPQKNGNLGSHCNGATVFACFCPKILDFLGNHDF